MSDSLRDQLLGLGFKPAPKPKPMSKPAPRPSKPDAARPNEARGRGKPAQKRQRFDAVKPDKVMAGEIGLARAYAIRAQREKDEQIQAEREKQAAARQRREAKAKLAALLQDKALNAPDAEIARHFSYGGRIKRIYVTAEQLPQLNTGLLGVVQLNGGYLLVDADTLVQAEAIFAPAIALKVDPNAPGKDDSYADPKYQVPDDLVW